MFTRCCCSVNFEFISRGTSWNVFYFNYLKLLVRRERLRNNVVFIRFHVLGIVHQVLRNVNRGFNLWELHGTFSASTGLNFAIMSSNGVQMEFELDPH